MTYCINNKCPFTDCEKHIRQNARKSGEITVANLDGVCRRYIIYIAERFWKVE